MAELPKQIDDALENPSNYDTVEQGAEAGLEIDPEQHSKVAEMETLILAEGASIMKVDEHQQDDSLE